MNTLVLSDLHLGATPRDVLRRPEVLERLLARLDGVERLILLGDTVELRGDPARVALQAAEPVLRAIGTALGPKAEVVLVPGNHDHALAAGWLDWRGRRETPPPLQDEQRIAPHHASWIAKRIAGWLAPASVEVAYPGVWIRDDVYALHGHYMDCHATLPTFERLAAGFMALFTEAIPDPATPEDYELVLSPMYAWMHQIAQRRMLPLPAAEDPSLRAWRTLRGQGDPRRHERALARAFPLAIMGVNRLGLGPVSPDVSGEGMRRSALAGLGEVVRRLRIDTAHVVFGHSHRAGPLPGDDLAEWRAPTGALLHNAGSWSYTEALTSAETARSNPYWPGRVIAVSETGPPQLESLLDELGAVGGTGFTAVPA